MTWQLLHRLFGLHFVVFQSGRSFVRRVRFTPTGRPFCTLYGDLIFLDAVSIYEWDALTFNKSQWLDTRPKISRSHEARAA